ncbi:hypothetical protein HDU91_000606, partial [Kappamyces sp. JEL0680]
LGSAAFADYNGNPSMTDVHRFMNLNKAQISFFNDMVGQAALGFGVTQEDAQAVGSALEGLFNIECGKPKALLPKLQPAQQGFCFGENCSGSINDCERSVQDSVRASAGNNAVGGANNNGNSGNNGGSIFNQNGVQRVIKCVPRNLGGSGLSNSNGRVYGISRGSEL